jgi:beta-galactosidase/beta-glucuronidase
VVRDELDLCGLWQFQLDPLGDGEKRRPSAPDCESDGWLQVRVPGSFDSYGPGLAHYEGGGWLRREFVAPSSWAGKRVVLRCEGANYHARVWVNGAWVGENRDGFLPFEFAVDEHLRIGERNVVAMAVDNRRLKEDVPGEPHGWQNFGGVLREIGLVACDRLRIERVWAQAQPAADGGQLVLRVRLANGRAAPAQAALRAAMRDRDGRVLATLGPAALALAAGGDAEATLEAPVPGAQPWSPDAPHLYRVEVVLEEGGSPVDELHVRTGFRRIEARDGRLLLNGEPLFLTGFNRHEDSPRMDMATDLDTVRQDLIAMREAGANFVRLCHYPHHPGELDLCDELGLLAMGEIPLYWWRGYGDGEEACARKLETAKRQIARMIERDIHHPSLIFWSVSNENHEELPEVVSGNAELVRLAQALDPTRLAVHVSSRWQEHPHFDPDDVICVNAYPAVSLAYGEGLPEERLEEATRYWRERLAEVHARYPDKPILVTEFGFMSLAEAAGGTFSEALHAQVLEAEFAGMDAPYVCGATIWCWADHPWPEVGFYSVFTLTTSPFGVVTRARVRKQPYWATQRMFRARRG